MTSPTLIACLLAADPATQGSDQFLVAKTRLHRLRQQASLLEFQVRTIEDIRVGKGEIPMVATAEIKDFPKSSKRKAK